MILYILNLYTSNRFSQGILIPFFPSPSLYSGTLSLSLQPLFSFPHPSLYVYPHLIFCLSLLPLHIHSAHSCICLCNRGYHDYCHDHVTGVRQRIVITRTGSQTGWLSYQRNKTDDHVYYYLFTYLYA